MKIIDRNTGKRIEEDNAKKKDIKRKESINRFVEKGIESEEEFSPMDPPTAYDDHYAITDIHPEEMHNSLHMMMEDHKRVVDQLNKFEESMLAFNEDGFHMTKEINDSFSSFFKFFDNEILPHNRQEERYLFPILNERLLESGEHSKETTPKTAVDLMEDDHVKFIQLATLTLNLLGLAVRLPDKRSQAMTLDLAYHSGMEMIELLRLHIYREDRTLFPLAQKLLTDQEFLEIEAKIKASA